MKVLVGNPYRYGWGTILCAECKVRFKRKERGFLGLDGVFCTHPENKCKQSGMTAREEDILVLVDVEPIVEFKDV